MSDRFEGWAQPVAQIAGGVSIVEHTYVKVVGQGPSYFECFEIRGHNLPGCRQLAGATGNGNYAVAACYRNGPPPALLPDSAGLAPYGVFGVCHQAANRFLYSATTWLGGPTVSDANGYMLSWFTWGTYGIPNPTPGFLWSITYAGCALGASLIEAPAPTQAAPVGADARIVALHRGLGASQTPPDPNAINLEECRIHAEEKLGKQFDITKLHELRTAHLADFATIAKSDLKGRPFANEVNGLVLGALEKVAAYLGAEQYQRFFGVSAGEQYLVVDPEIAAASAEPAGASAPA